MRKYHFIFCVILYVLFVFSGLSFGYEKETKRPVELATYRFEFDNDAFFNKDNNLSSKERQVAWDKKTES